jgi:amidase
MSVKDEICYSTAVDLAASIRSRDLSAREVMEAHLRQIERVNPKVNAIVTQIPADSPPSIRPGKNRPK